MNKYTFLSEVKTRLQTLSFSGKDAVVYTGLKELQSKTGLMMFIEPVNANGDGDNLVNEFRFTVFVYWKSSNFEKAVSDILDIENSLVNRVLEPDGFYNGNIWQNCNTIYYDSTEFAILNTPQERIAEISFVVDIMRK